MGKKQKRGSKQSIVPHREAFMRMNFLFQASLAVLSANPSHPQLSRFYVHTMKSVSKRLVLRMDPSVKRLLCKSCDSLLVPGVTATHRLRARREKHLVVKCLTCGRVKRFLARPDYQLWSDNPSNITEPPTATVEPPPPTTAEQPPTTAEPPPPTTAEPPLPTTAEQPPTTAEPPPTTAEPPPTTAEPTPTTAEPPPTTAEPPPPTTDGQITANVDHSVPETPTNPPTSEPLTANNSAAQTNHPQKS